MKNLLLLLALITFTLSSCSSSDDNANEPIVANCLAPLNLSVLQITSTSVILDWENPNNNSNVDIEYGLTGFTPGTGINNPEYENTTISTSENSIRIDGLTPDISYDFYIQSLCSEDNVSIVSSFDSPLSPYAGTWNGTYDGDDSGTWTITWSFTGEFISGSNFSNNSQTTILTASATLNADGYTEGLSENGTTSKGQYSENTANGTWINPNNGLSGTMTGSRQ